MPKTASKGRKPAPLTARTADRHRLYEAAVQCPEAEIDFVDRTFRRLRGRNAVLLREDFCATAATACEWVRRRPENRSLALDINGPVLAWAKKHNVGALPEEARSRITLLKRNVLEPGDATGVDAVLAFNFSYWVFMTRDLLRSYFESVRASLADDGVFFLDIYGGYESMKEMQERRRQKGFTYVWDQAEYDPLTGTKVCKIHFEFPDGTRMKDAFVYRWRLWTPPEIRELLQEAGFSRVTIYWEGEDAKGRGTGVFRPRARGEADPCFVSYITAER